MKRRNFISMLAGLLAVPAAIKGFFGKQDFSIDYSKIRYRYIKPRPTISSDFEKEVNEMWKKHYKTYEKFQSYNDGFDEDAIEAMVTGGKKDFVPLPTFGKNNLPKHLKHLCA